MCSCDRRVHSLQIGFHKMELWGYMSPQGAEQNDGV